MYKRFSIEEIQTIKNDFVGHLCRIMQRERIYDLKQFLKFSFQRGDTIYYFQRGNPTFRIGQQGELLQFVDEKDKIELILPKENINKLNPLVKNYMLKKNKKMDKKSITAILAEEFLAGHYMTLNDKPYLVYDIETSSNIANLKDTEFYLAYSMAPGEGNKMNYEYIGQDDLVKFFRKLKEFDGYIIGFNNMAFDNPVVTYAAGGTDEDLAAINAKSLDLFLFVRNMTGKRIGLNKISQALVDVEKTLDVGAEGDSLRRKYLETGDKQYLDEFKKYCKNDVKMTALVMLYMLHYKKMFIDGEEFTYTIEDFVKLASKQREKTKGPATNKSIFH